MIYIFVLLFPIIGEQFKNLKLLDYILTSVNPKILMCYVLLGKVILGEYSAPNWIVTSRPKFIILW